MKRLLFSLVAFIVSAQTAFGIDCFSGFSQGHSTRRFVRSYSRPLARSYDVVKEIVREVQVPVYVYPVANYNQPNPYLQAAQWKQQMNQLQRMQDSIEAYAEAYGQQHVVQQQPYIPPQPQQTYGQAYTQQPQPYGQYAPQQPAYGQQQAYAAPQPQQGECSSCVEVLRALLGPHLQQQNGQPMHQRPNQLPPPQTEPEGYASVLSNRCAECHSGANPKGGFDLSRLAGMDLQRRFQAFQRAARGEMPPPSPNRPPLTSAELGILFGEMHTPEEAGQLMNKNKQARTKDQTAAPSDAAVAKAE